MLGLRGFPQVQGGVEKHCEHLAPWLVRLGCEVTVLTRQPYMPPGIANYRGVRLVPLRAPRNRSLETFMHTLWGILAAWRLQPDVLHLQAIGPAFWTPLARLLGLRVVVTHHGPDYERQKWGFLAKLILRWGERLGAVFANGLIAVAPHIAAHLTQHYGRTAHVIPNGVKLAGPRHTSDCLAAYGLKPGRYFLAVGRIVPEKGFCDLVEAFRLFSERAKKPESPEWKLVIVGRADHASAYSQRLERLAAAQPQVVATGFLSGRPLEELYSHAGIFILPSYYEGLPLVLLEALSYGLSCLVSDIAAHRGVDLHLEENRFFKPGDLGELSQKMADWVGQPPTLEQREQWRCDLNARYNWRTIADQTLAVYRGVVRNRTQPLHGGIKLPRTLSAGNLIR
jgi:glycosyltransferase involved in cell wall biosynthesis